MTAIDMKSASIQLRALAHPTRLAILEELSQGPKCVKDLEGLLPVRQDNISLQLAILRHTQLVDLAQNGHTRCDHFARPTLVGDLLSLLGRSDPVVPIAADENVAHKAKPAARKLTKSHGRANSGKRKETSR